MSAIERANIPRPPTQSTTPGIGITRLATSVTEAPYDLTPYDHLFSRKLRLSVEGTDGIWVNFSATAGTTLAKGTAGGSTIANGTVLANGFKIQGNSFIEVCLSKAQHGFMHVQADANTPVLCITPVGHRGPRTGT